MRVWMTVLSLLWVLGVPRANALPEYGPKVDLFDFAGFEWMADGVWLCWDNCDSEDIVFYVVAEPSANRIDVYIARPAEGLARDEPEGAAANCTIVIGVFSGRVYAIQDQNHSFIFTSRGSASFSTLLFLLLDFAGLTDAPGSGLYFSGIRADLALDSRQMNLVEMLEKGDISVLDTEEWKDIWGKIQKTGAQDVAQFRADDDLDSSIFLFDRLDHKGRTSPALKRSLVQRAILLGTFVGFDNPEVSWAQIKDLCLDPADLEQWGYRP